MKIKVIGRDIFADTCKIGRITGSRLRPYYSVRPNRGYQVFNRSDQVCVEYLASFADAVKHVRANVEILMDYDTGRLAARENKELPIGCPPEFERGWRDEVERICRNTDHTVTIQKIARQVGL